MGIKPFGLASSFTIAVISLCCCADNAFVGYYVIAGCAELMLASFALGVLLSAVLLTITRQSASHRIAQIILASCLSLGGIVALWMGTNAQPSICAVIGGVLLGAGSVAMLGQWANCFSRFEKEAVLPNVALSLFCSAVIWCLLRLANGFVSTCLAMAICTVCAGIVAIMGNISTRDKDLAAEELLQTSAQDGQSEVRAALTSVESFVFDSQRHMGRWHALETGCALVLGFFVIGAAYWPNAMEMELPAAFTKPLCYFVAAAIALFVSHYATSFAYRGHDERQPMRAVLVVAALLILGGACLSATWGEASRPIVHMGNLMAFAILNVYGISYTFVDVLSNGISPARSCVVVVCLCYVGMALGILAYLLLGSFAFIAVAILAVVYAVLIIVIAIQAVRGGRSSKNYQRRSLD